MILVPSDPMIPQKFRVMDIRSETADTCTMTLESSENIDVCFLPGQFNMLYAFGVGEVPVSISGDPSKPGQLVHTLRAVGAVTNALCKLKPGDSVGVRGPFGIAWPMDEAKGRDVVIMTGGIGLAPLRPVIYHILNNRDYYNRVTLLYGARLPDELLFSDEIHEWRSRFDMDVAVTVDGIDEEEEWHGHVGVVTTLVKRADFDPANTLAMICGPEIMIRYAMRELYKVGLPLNNVYVSMERNMKCGIGLCGHCQMGSKFVCKDGPVFNYAAIRHLFKTREI